MVVLLRCDLTFVCAYVCVCSRGLHGVELARIPGVFVPGGRIPLEYIIGHKNRPASFPGRMSYKATKPGLVSVLYLGVRYDKVYSPNDSTAVEYKIYIKEKE